MIHYIEQFQINIYAVLMLLVILLIIEFQSRIEFYSKKLLKAAILINILALIMEPASWIADGHTSLLGYSVSWISNILLVLLGPVIAGLFASYADYKLFRDRRRLKRRMFYLAPSMVILLLLAVNFFNPIYFSLDGTTGKYTAGSYQWINHIIILWIYLNALIKVNRNRKNANSRIMHFVMLFFAVPIIGMFIQFFYIRLNFSWTTLSLGILVAYAFLESTTGEKDFLTQLYSRASYEEYVKLLIEEKRPFMLMLIDLDGFKRINDTYGHFVGDQMLIEFSRILMHQFSSEKMISRLAGDEFVIVLENHRDIDEDRFVKEMVKQCRESAVPHVPQLKFSYGIQEYKQEMTFDELYIQVDHKMYMNKNY